MAAGWVGCFRFHGLLATGEGPVLVAHDGQVWDANGAARARGVRPGQVLAAARSACPEARTILHDPVRGRAALRRACDFLAEASGTVEPDPGGRPRAVAAWIAATAPLPELRSLRAALARALPPVQLACGLAPNRLLAEACCPEEGFAVVAPGGEAAFLAPLPLDRLTEMGLLSPAWLRRLAGMALHNCGAVAEIPPAAMEARFGAEGLRIQALCRGRDLRGVAALHPPRMLRARGRFSEGLPAERWAEAAAGLARQAAAGLRPGEGAGGLRLRGEGGEWRRELRQAQTRVGLLARAAGALALRAARAGAVPTEWLEVDLTDLAIFPPEPLSLLSLGRGHKRHLEDVLDRLPRGSLRRGSEMQDWYERLLPLLDPWRGRLPGGGAASGSGWPDASRP